MKIYIASDHAGYELKEKLVDFLIKENGHEVVDKGAFEYDEKDDYPDFVSIVAKKVSENPDTRGIILGGSGQGEAMVANRFKNVRAAVFYGGNTEVVEVSRQHNDSNILSLGARFLSEEETKEAVKIWLETNFSEGDRHIRRINKIDNFCEFDEWNGLKKYIDKKDNKVLFKERDVFYIKNGKNIGFEQDGKGKNFSRPVLVFKKFNNDIFWGVPLSKTKKTGKYYLQFSFKNGIMSNALLSQLRLFDAKRLMEKKGFISVEDYNILKTKINHIING